MIVGVESKVVTTLFDWASSVEDVTSRAYPTQMTILDAPDAVRPGWTYDATTGAFSAPVQSGWAWDDTDARYYDHESYRKILHDRTVSDTMEALRKLREEDTTIDWQAWLDMLDAYNVAVSATKGQETYPDVVVYPDYPTRPTASE